MFMVYLLIHVEDYEIVCFQTLGAMLPNPAPLAVGSTDPRLETKSGSAQKRLGSTNKTFPFASKTDPTFWKRIPVSVDPTHADPKGFSAQFIQLNY
jgi:hypothetical protein